MEEFQKSFEGGRCILANDRRSKPVEENLWKTVIEIQFGSGKPANFLKGDTVNLSSRLGDIAQKLDQEGNIGTKPGGGIVIEAETRSKLGDFPAHIHPLKLPPIKGKSRSVEAYRVIS